MRLSLEHERLVRMIKESISLMCKSSLSYDIELNVEGLLGITLDKKDIFLVNIKESFQSNVPKENTEEVHTPPKRSRSDIIEIKEEEFEQLSSCSRKKRSRRRSHNNSPGNIMSCDNLRNFVLKKLWTFVFPSRFTWFKGTSDHMLQMLILLQV